MSQFEKQSENSATLSENDLYYLRSIRRQMELVAESLADTAAFSLGGFAFTDNLNWLDCFIDAHERRTPTVSSHHLGDEAQ